MSLIYNNNWKHFSTEELCIISKGFNHLDDNNDFSESELKLYNLLDRSLMGELTQRTEDGEPHGDDLL